jgi:hypothetical protein
MQKKDKETMKAEDYFGYVKRGLWVLIKNVEPEHKGLVKRMIDNTEYGIEAHREEVTEAKNIGVRNPAFEGDMVGWLDDDFDESDDDEDETKNTK